MYGINRMNNYFGEPQFYNYDENNQLKEKNKKLSEEIQYLNQQVSDLQKEIKEKKSKITAISIEKKNVQANLEQLKGDIYRFQEENKELENKIEDNKEKIDKFNSEKNKLNTEINNLNKEIRKLYTENNKLNTEINKLNKENKKQNTIIENLNTTHNNEISKYKSDNDELRNLLIGKDKKYKELNLDELKKKNEDLKNNDISQKEQIIMKSKEIDNLKEMNLNLKKENENNKNNIFKLKEENEKINNEKNEKIQHINNLEDKIKQLEDSIRSHKDVVDELITIKENADKSLKYENSNQVDFYDIIIKCNSILGLKNGWEVLMTEKGKEKYAEYKNTKLTKIGIIGSENRGKSTILSDLSQIELPTGVSIKTEGLSIKYPELNKCKNRKIILLDSAGLETPILRTDIEMKKSSTLSQDKQQENCENGNEEIKKEYKKENILEVFENKSRDVIQLELFLQNFIIKYSDILILILGKLSINEQKLLLKVNTHIKNINRKEPLIIIHNLKDFETRKQVEDYLENTLKKSLSFSLEESDDIDLENEESDWKALYEPNSEPKIYHLIYGQKGKESGNYYNQKAINHIYKLINLGTDKESFDPIECVKTYFSEISPTILDSPNEKLELVYNQDVISKEGEMNNRKEISKIMLKEPNKPITLKKCLIDELGIVQGNFNVQYSYYITDKKVFVYVELPGKSPESDKDIEYEDVEVDAVPEGSFYVIKITGKKKHCYEKIINTSATNQIIKRQFGEFVILIKLDKINLDEIYEHKIENGCLILEFNIKKNQNKKKI